MKKILLPILLIGGVVSFGNVVLASDGTIHFKGNIINEACTVDTNSKNQTVILGDIAAASFSAAGDKSTPTKFTINVTDCPATVKQIAFKFDGINDSDNTKLLKLDSGMTATKVGIEISDSNGVPIDLHTSSPKYNVAADGSASLEFIGRYVATAATVGAGTADGTSEFTINYQ
ncbi:fimbrial protein [Citrobacter amalonaticus]|uniref:fimbrial protein n=1 Tax=Citrobacter amalonaticus TaxID=35703 RepID=UPI00300D044D